MFLTGAMIWLQFCHFFIADSLKMENGNWKDMCSFTQAFLCFQMASWHSKEK